MLHTLSASKETKDVDGKFHQFPNVNLPYISFNCSGKLKAGWAAYFKISSGPELTLWC